MACAAWLCVCTVLGARTLSTGLGFKADAPPLACQPRRRPGTDWHEPGTPRQQRCRRTWDWLTLTQEASLISKSIASIHALAAAAWAARMPWAGCRLEAAGFSHVHTAQHRSQRKHAHLPRGRRSTGRGATAPAGSCPPICSAASGCRSGPPPAAGSPCAAAAGREVGRGGVGLAFTIQQHTAASCRRNGRGRHRPDGAATGGQGAATGAAAHSRQHRQAASVVRRLTLK